MKTPKRKSVSRISPETETKNSRKGWMPGIQWYDRTTRKYGAFFLVRAVPPRGNRDKWTGFVICHPGSSSNQFFRLSTVEKWPTIENPTPGLTKTEFEADALDKAMKKWLEMKAKIREAEKAES